jgi:hypothetical protein
MMSTMTDKSRKKALLLAAIGMLAFLLDQPAVAGTAAADGTDSYQDSSALYTSVSSPQDQSTTDASDTQSDSRYPVPVPPLRLPFWSAFGKLLPAGWSMSLSTQVLGLYDSNPLQSPSAPSADIAGSYSGVIEVAKFSEHARFIADYMPEYTMYRRFDALSNLQQRYYQALTLDLSRNTTFSWHLNARHFPAWGGSSFAGSDFGALVMALTGTSEHDLMSSVTNANTDFGIDHRINVHSHVDFGVNGSASWFGAAEGNLYANLLNQPSSKAWCGGGTLGYTFDINSRRSAGVDVGQSYCLYASQNYHQNYQTAHFRYRQTLNRNWQYYVEIGPGFRENQPESSAVTPGFDLSVAVNRMTKQTILSATLTRTYSVGLFQGNQTAWYGTLAAQHIFGQHWKVGFFTNYSGSFHSPEAQVYNDTTTNAYWVSGLWGYRFGRQLTWNTNYGYAVYQGYYSGASQVNKNQVATGFVFTLNDAHGH